MKLFVLDTHVYVAYAKGDLNYFSKLVRKFIQLLDLNQCIFYIPTISFWEIGYKASIGDLKIKGYNPEESLTVFQKPLNSNPNFRDLPLTRGAASLAPTFKSKLIDPFDQLIVASAVEANLPLITKDQNIQKSELVRVVW